MAVIPVAPGRVAAIVTKLAMTQRPRPSPVAASPLRLVRWKAPEPEKYRTLFRRVGEPWLWFSRLILTDEALAALLTDPRTEIFAVCDPKGVEIGLLELDFSGEAACRIAFLGLVPQLTGQGFGRWLLSQALMLGWRKGVEQMTVQTCTLDHARALPLYLDAGFRPTTRVIEIFDDPRLSGLLDADAAPHIPLI
ncbi:MAG: GNAT family N-acetyltransferase [Sphingobium sp.]